MPEYVFAPAPIPTVPVEGTDALFPVRRIFCVGRNYAAHAREMGKDPDREPPFFFTKPADAVAMAGEALAYPALTEDLHHEGEFVVALGSGGRDVAEADALGLVFGYAVGNDLTRRDLQAEAKKMGRPWDGSKAFDRSAVCGPIRPVAACGHPVSGAIRVAVNGAPRQEGDLADMIWSVPEIISILSAAFELKAGDLIYTGTPAGVGALVPGDECVVEIEGFAPLVTRILPRG